MSIRFEVPGKERKHLAQAVGEWLDFEVKYNGAPTFSYSIGFCGIDRDGCISFEAGTDEGTIERLIEHLVDLGFQCDMSIPEEPEVNGETHLNISVPAAELDERTLANLQQIIDAKGSLLKAALGAEDLPILKLKDTINFPWFKLGASAEEGQTYIKLISALIDMARNAKRITAKEKEIDNPKYAFRCFLLRLGFIGDDYKEDRKILLKNLTGSSAFKSGAKKEVQE